MALLVIGVIVIAGGGIFYLAAQQEKERRLATQALAARLGWAYEPEPPVTIVGAPGRTELFTTGRGQTIRNHVSGEWAGLRMAAFDFSYVTGFGRSRQTWHQTVVHVRVPGRGLPAFVLQPENVLHRFAGLFGYQDIDVEADPEYSRRYLLRGADEASIRALFDANVRDFYHRHAESYTEAAGADLFVWRTNWSLEPGEIEPLLDRAADLARRLAPHAAPLPAA